MSPVLVNPFLFNAGGGGDPGGDDWFAADGKTWPWYGQAPHPAAMYVSATTTTWFAWETYGAGVRGIRVTTYNHTAESWGPIYLAREHALTDNDHGVPSLCRDDEGYVHLFYGGHNSDVFHAVTNEADDPSSWWLAHTFSGVYTYPMPALVGTNLYLVLQEDVPANTKKTAVIFKTTALALGVPTWGSEGPLVDFGDNSIVYFGPLHVVSTDLHFTASRANGTDTSRQDVHYFVYETVTGDVHNAEDDATITAANLPVDLTEANTDFRVIDQATGGTFTNRPGFCFDTNGDAHLVYMDGATANGTSWDIKHVKFSAGTWSSPATVVSLTNQSRYTGIAAVPMASAEIACWYSVDSGAAWGRGGDMTRKVRSSGGSWGTAETMKATDGYALDEPFAIRSGHADARVAFCEIAADSDDASGGDLKVFAHGDSGFLRRTAPTVTDTHIAKVALLLDGERTGSGTDTHIASVVLLLQGV